MRDIPDIIEDWRHECGIQKTGKSGSYRLIPFNGKKDLLLALAQTMIDEGYKEEDLKSMSTRNAVCNACAAPDAANIKNNKKIKQITADQWKDVLKEFYRGSVSQYRPNEVQKSYVPKEDIEQKGKDLDKILNPSTRIVSSKKFDRSNDTNWDLLNELGITPPDEETE